MSKSERLKKLQIESQLYLRHRLRDLLEYVCEKWTVARDKNGRSESLKRVKALNL